MLDKQDSIKDLALDESDHCETFFTKDSLEAQHNLKDGVKNQRGQRRYVKKEGSFRKPKQTLGNFVEAMNQSFSVGDLAPVHDDLMTVDSRKNTLGASKTRLTSDRPARRPVSRNSSSASLKKEGASLGAFVEAMNESFSVGDLAPVHDDLMTVDSRKNTLGASKTRLTSDRPARRPVSRASSERSSAEKRRPISRSASSEELELKERVSLGTFVEAMNESITFADLTAPDVEDVMTVDSRKNTLGASKTRLTNDRPTRRPISCASSGPSLSAFVESMNMSLQVGDLAPDMSDIMTLDSRQHVLSGSKSRLTADRPSRRPISRGTSERSSEEMKKATFPVDFGSAVF
jgi:hypothetical protein